MDTVANYDTSGSETSTRKRRMAAWGVHAYTATGLPIAFLATVALYEGNASAFFLALCVAALVDATDGTLARRVRVKEVLPEFDGSLLDNLIDFLTFAFLPVLALPTLGILPDNWIWVACFPLIASGYGFCQSHAKTEDSFVGFPSYWNIVVLYLYVLDAPPHVAVGVIVLLSLLVFVPIHYLYPSKTRLWMPMTVVAGFLWAGAMFAISLAPDAPWAKTAAWISLYYPVYYFLASGVHHRRVRRRQP